MEGKVDLLLKHSLEPRLGFALAKVIQHLKSPGSSVCRILSRFESLLFRDPPRLIFGKIRLLSVALEMGRIVIVGQSGWSTDIFHVIAPS